MGLLLTSLLCAPVWVPPTPPHPHLHDWVEMALPAIFSPPQTLLLQTQDQTCPPAGHNWGTSHVLRRDSFQTRDSSRLTMTPPPTPPRRNQIQHLPLPPSGRVACYSSWKGLRTLGQSAGRRPEMPAEGALKCLRTNQCILVRRYES